MRIGFLLFSDPKALTPDPYMDQMYQNPDVILLILDEEVTQMVGVFYFIAAGADAELALEKLGDRGFFNK